MAKSIYHMDLDQLLPVIKQVCRIDLETETTAMLNFYHDLGVIVKHGRTVVLKAQWLINLFKKLITVPCYEKAVSEFCNLAFLIYAQEKQNFVCRAKRAKRQETTISKGRVCQVTD